MSHSVSLLQFEYAWDIQAYLRFASILFEENNAEYPSVETTGELPQLTVDNTIIGRKEILKYLKEEVCDIDAEFPDDVQKEVIVYSYLIDIYANSVYSSAKWTHIKEVNKYLAPIYNNVLSFPYNHLFYRKMGKQSFSKIGVTIASQDEEQFAMLNNIYRVLSNKLYINSSSSDQESLHFLYGEKPSSLDAVLFGHIAQVMEYPAGIQSHLLCFPGLISYYESIMKRYFSAARGEGLSNNVFIKMHGLRISTQPTKSIESVLPYRDVTYEYNNLETENIKVAEEKVDAEKTYDIRKDFIYFIALGLTLFVTAVVQDLELSSVCSQCFVLRIELMT